MKVFGFCFLLPVLVISQRIRIPDNLIYCYRGGENNDFMRNSWFPSSLTMVIDIVRKIEQAFPTSIDLRHLSARLFHDLRVDGIQRSFSAIESEDITIYGVTGFMTNKNRILRQIISDVSGSLKYQELLTPSELCVLHKLLSSSIDIFENQNELRTCPRHILYTTSLQSNIREILPGQLFPNRRSHNNHTIIAPNFSRCPIETGVVYNDYGAIHLGVIMASIASGMQPQNVKINEFITEYHERDLYANLETMEETDNRQKIEKLLSSLSSVDNTYSSLAGDLAEVVLYQGSILGHNFSIGFSGLWNDTYFPRCHHLNGSRNGYFHLTDSEILSGLDGFFMSQQVSSWSTRIRRLRLSQILDMYYNHQGISIPIIETANHNNFYGGRKKSPKNKINDDEKADDEQIKFDGKNLFRKAYNLKNLNEELLDVDGNYLSRFLIAQGINSVCHRLKILEMIDTERLKDETFSFIKILEVVTNTPVISSALLKSLTNSAVDKMMTYTKKLLTSETDCSMKPINFKKPRVDLTLIIDGSRDYYENLQFINYIAELIGVSRFGSYLSVVHGNNGVYIANKTNNIADLFSNLRNSSFDVPFRLSPLNALSNVIETLSAQFLEEKSSGSYLEMSKVILLVSQSNRISQSDFENTRWLLRTSMLQFPDLYLIFLTNDVNTFQEMVYNSNGNPVTSARMLIEFEDRYRFINAPSVEISTFDRLLQQALNSIPKRIISPFCQNKNDKSAMTMLREEFEDYAMPNVELFYRISPYYLGSDEIRIRFQGVGYGDLTICMSRHFNMTNKECQTIQDIENVWFNITDPCNNHHVSNKCTHIYFTVTVDTSYVRCSEFTCRFPDDVRFNVRPEGLRCEKNFSKKIRTNLNLIIVTFLIVIIVLKQIDNYTLVL